MATDNEGRMPNPLVSEVHAKEKPWGAEFAALRAICLDSGLHEDLKWGQACYDLEQKNVVLIHGFKDYCALLFMKGALLPDPGGLLVQQTKNVQSARQMRFKSVDDIDKLKGDIERTLKEAIAVEKAGAKVSMKPASQYDVPSEFKVRLAADPALARAFGELTPGRQKAYLLHFADAKLPATREARVQKHAPRIMQGLGLND